ncbi:MAG TPA: WHG domain-containing protein [Actinomycetota bacterium]|nr:WHG domain-containing protein [Actinomycetota bacterium]
MSEPSPRVAEIVAAARSILETEGREGLTMRALASRLGIQAPSLYKHVADKDELEALLVADAFRELGAALHDAIDALGPRRPARRRALQSLAGAYRAWALAHPGPYRLATEGELARDRMPDGLEAWTAAPLVAAAGSADRARAVWAFAHGMTILEIDGRFPGGADLDAAWSEGIAAFA